jgi:hypothetical protein
MKPRGWSARATAARGLGVCRQQNVCRSRIGEVCVVLHVDGPICTLGQSEEACHVFAGIRNSCVSTWLSPGVRLVVAADAGVAADAARKGTAAASPKP